MDETCVTTVQTKFPKVRAAISAERGKTLTVVFAMKAAENDISLMLMYPRKRMQATLQKTDSIGASCKCYKNGFNAC